MVFSTAVIVFPLEIISGYSEWLGTEFLLATCYSKCGHGEYLNCNYQGVFLTAVDLLVLLLFSSSVFGFPWFTQSAIVSPEPFLFLLWRITMTSVLLRFMHRRTLYP